MSSKTSLFNKAIIKSDLKRFWWIPVLIMLFLVFMLPDSVAKYVDYDTNKEWFDYSSDEGLFASVSAFFTSAMLFSYLHNGNSVSALHGIPVKRTEQYISHYISGVILVMIPVIIASAVIAMESLYLGDTIKYAVKYFYTCSLYAGMIFSITAFASVISGSTVASVVFSCGFIILPGFIIATTEAILNENLYGFIGTNYSEFIFEYIYLMNIDEVWSYTSLWYIAAIVIISAIGLVLYKIRKLENYDEVVAFKYLRIAFVYVLAVCFGIFGYFMIREIFHFNNLFIGIMPLGIIAIIGANMLNNKSFTLKGILKPVVVLGVCAAIVHGCFAFDLTGFENRIPALEDIESIEMTKDYQYVNNTEPYYKEGIYYNNVRYMPVITDRTEIENIYNMHSKLISNRELSNKEHYYTYGGDVISFKYSLKDGSNMERSYFVSNIDYKDYLNNYYSTDAYKKIYYPVLNDNRKVINYANYVEYDKNYAEVKLNIDMNKLMEAIKSDVMAKDSLAVSRITDEDIDRIQQEESRILPEIVDNVDTKVDDTISVLVFYDEYIDYDGRELKFSCEDRLEISKETFPNTYPIVKAAIDANS